MRLWHKCYLFDLWGWCKTAAANIDWWEVRIVVFVLYCALKGRPRSGRPGDQGSMKCEHGQLMSLWKGTDGDGNKVFNLFKSYELNEPRKSWWVPCRYSGMKFNSVIFQREISCLVKQMRGSVGAPVKRGLMTMKGLTFQRVKSWINQGSLDEYHVDNQKWNLTRLFSERNYLPCEANEDSNQEKRWSER